MKRIINKIRRWIFGYDIFISYSRADSLDYAYTLARHFMDKGYECYIDQLSSIAPGKELPSNIKNAVKRSTSFVLVGSRGAQKSEPIGEEVKLFLGSSRNRPLIPITVGGAISVDADWYNLVEGLALIDDTNQNLEAGQPAQDVYERVENALKFTKKSKRLRYIAFTTLLVVFLIAGGAFFYSSYQVSSAQKKVATADSLKSKAFSERDTALAIRDTALGNLKKVENEKAIVNKDLEVNKKLLDQSKGELEEANKDLVVKQEEIKTKNTEILQKEAVISNKEKEVKSISRHLDSLRYEEAGLKAVSHSNDINKQDEAIRAVFEYFDLVEKHEVDVSPRAWQGLNSTVKSLKKQTRLEVGNVAKLKMSGIIKGNMSNDRQNLAIYDAEGRMGVFHISSGRVDTFTLDVRRLYYPEIGFTKNLQVIFAEEESSNHQSISTFYIRTVDGTIKELTSPVPYTDLEVFNETNGCVTVHGNGGVVLWNLSSGQKSLLYDGDETWVKTRISSDDKYLASTSISGPAPRGVSEEWGEYFKVWDMENKRLVLSKFLSTKEARGVDDIAFSPDGKYVAVGGGGQVDAFEVLTGEVVFSRDFNKPNHVVTNIGFMKGLDGYDLVFNIGGGGDYYIFALEDIPSHLQPMDFNEGLYRIEDLSGYRYGKFEKDGTFIAKEGEDVVRLKMSGYNYGSFDVLGSYSISNNKLWDFFYVDSYSFISIQNNGELYYHYLPETNNRSFLGYNLSNNRSSYNNFGKLVKSEMRIGEGNSSLCTIQVVSTEMEKAERSYSFKLPGGPGYTHPYYRFSENGKYLLLRYDGITNDTTMVWDLEAGQAIPIYTFGDSVELASFSDKEHILLVKKCTYEKDNAASARQLSSIGANYFNLKNSAQTAIDISGATENLNCNIYDIWYNDYITNLYINEHNYATLTLRYEGASALYSFDLYEASTQKHIKRLYSGRNRPLIEVSENGNLAVISLGKSVKVFDLTDGTTLKTLSGHQEDISSHIFYLDGQYLIAGGKKGSLYIWHINSGIKIYEAQLCEWAIDRLFLMDETQLICHSLSETSVLELSFKNKFKELCNCIKGRKGFEEENKKCNNYFN